MATRITFHLAKFRLKADALEKKRRMSVTLAVFQLLMSMLNLLSANMYAMFATFATFQFEIPGDIVST